MKLPDKTPFAFALHDRPVINPVGADVKPAAHAAEVIAPE